MDELYIVLVHTWACPFPGLYIIEWMVFCLQSCMTSCLVLPSFTSFLSLARTLQLFTRQLLWNSSAPEINWLITLKLRFSRSSLVNRLHLSCQDQHSLRHLCKFSSLFFVTQIWEEADYLIAQELSHLSKWSGFMELNLWHGLYFCNCMFTLQALVLFIVQACEEADFQR